MKISKFVWSVVVAFVAVGLVVPQQAEAVPIIPTASGLIKFSGFVTLSKDPNAMTSSLDFDSVKTTLATGFFASIANGTTLDLETLTIDDTNHTILPDVFMWFVVSIPGKDFAEFNHPNGLAQVRLGPPTWSFVSFGSGELAVPGFLSNVFYFQLKVTGTAERIPFTGVVASPDDGSALGLLGIGLVGLVAVEGLRRKIATRQNRYT